VEVAPAPDASCACPVAGAFTCVGDSFYARCAAGRWEPSEPPAGAAICDGRCADLLTDPANCGECGKRCDEGVDCVFGGCGEPPAWEGIRTDVPLAELAGWERCWSSRYDQTGFDLATIQAQCPGRRLLLGCGSVGSATLTVAAQGLREDVLFVVPDDKLSVHTAGGVAWYYNSAVSWGFAPPGVLVYRNTCDINPADGRAYLQEDQRLCWHAADGRLKDGWRCGSNRPLNAGDAASGSFERVIYQVRGPQVGPVEGELRLVDGSTPYEGRVEIYHAGEWGTVCDDYWTANLNAATVVCRQLGYGAAVRATNNSSFGDGAGPIWLDNVQCTGPEARLVDCPHNEWGVHNCNHGTDAGVVCTGP